MRGSSFFFVELRINPNKICQTIENIERENERMKIIDSEKLKSRYSQDG